MKIKSIRISGMRKLTDEVYNMQKINYIMGKNGSGKSTIIDAIRLSILGYIPGTPKQLKKIMENSNSHSMSTAVVLEGPDGDVTIRRMWIRKGQSVEQHVETVPEKYDIESLISGIELPVYNFDEMLSKSANDQKDYFIKNILSGSDTKSGLVDKIKDKIKETNLDPKYTSKLEEDLVSHAEEFIGTSDSEVASVQLLNKYLKERQSATKAQIAEAEKTLSTLVKVDEDETFRSSEELNDLIKLKNDEIYKCKAHDADVSAMKRWEISAGDLLSEVEAFDINSDTKDSAEYAALIEARKSYDRSVQDTNSKISEISEKINSIRDQISDLKSDISNFDKTISSGGVCQYTKQVCPEIAKMIDDLKEQRLEKEKKLAPLNDMMSELTDEKSKLQKDMNSLGDMLTEPQAAYDELSKKYIKLKALKTSKPATSKYEGKQLDILENELEELNGELSKAVQAETYEKLHNKLLTEKAQYEVDLEIVKILIKYTGPNELQNTLMEEPFKDFAKKMTKYVSKLLGDEQLEAAFNLSTSANSFSFGVTRGGGYIPYQTLSSGEKCLYMIAFAITIMNHVKNRGELDVILLDDVLDHLDNKNASYVFENLVELNLDTEFIMAGVVGCTNKLVNKIRIK